MRFECALVAVCCFLALVGLSTLGRHALPGAAVVAVILVFGFYRFPGPIGYDHFGEEFVKVLRPDRKSMYQLVINPGIHQDQWPVAAAVSLEMVRAGCRVCVQPEWVFMFGQQMACSDGEPVTRLSFYP